MIYRLDCLDHYLSEVLNCCKLRDTLFKLLVGAIGTTYS